MGVVYKLNSEVTSFIIQEKRFDSLLSCRRIVSLVEEKFQIKISKSSVNSLIKEMGLSMPVGRRCNPKRNKIEALELGIIFLKAADYLVGGSHYITELVRKQIPSLITRPQSNTEYLLYYSLFNKSSLPSFLANSGPVLFSDINIADKTVTSFSAGIEKIKVLPADTEELIFNGFQNITGVKLSLSDGRIFYFDGQMHTIWPSTKIPFSFSTAYYNIKNRVKKCFQGDLPFILFMAPGYNIPSKEFYDFLSILDSGDGDFSQFSLYGSQFEELGDISLEGVKKSSFIFGLWPWQFTEYRKIKFLGEFRRFEFSPLNNNFYIAEIEISLLQPGGDKTFSLRGAALKTGSNEDIKMFIIGNFPADKVSLEDLAGMYLNRWPNLEETFRDFSRKIELFAEKNISTRFLSMRDLKIETDKTINLDTLFDYYLNALDLYVRNYFLPGEYRDKDLKTIKNRFYNLKGIFKEKRGNAHVNFKPPSGYLFLKDLKYACRRVNELGVMIADKKRLWCSVIE